MRNWEDILPPHCAAQQRDYERDQEAYRMHLAGFSYKDIMCRQGIKRQRAWVRVVGFLRRRSPVERYFAETGDLLKIRAKLQRNHQRRVRGILHIFHEATL